MGVSVKVRESNIELLRVISILFIILHHFVNYKYEMYGSLALFSFNNFVFSFFLSGGKFGVILFAMITGYFMIGSRISFKKIFLLEMQVLFYTMVMMFLFVFLGGYSVSERELLKFIFPNCMKTYWFFSSYFILYLCIPIMNFILLKIRKECFLGVLGFLFAYMILVPSFVIYADGLYEGFYLFFYYVVGAYIRLFLKEVKGQKRFLFGSIFFYLMIVGSSIFLQYLSSFNEILRGYIYSFSRISSVLVFASSICLFLYFKNLKLKESRWINRLGSVCFGVYLFHEHIYMRRLLWNMVFDANVLVNSPYFFVLGIFIAVIIFMIGGIFDWIRQLIFKHFGYMIVNVYSFFRKRLLLKCSSFMVVCGKSGEMN